jgi:hypothetical protein
MPNNYSMPKKPSQSRPPGMPLRKPSAKTVAPKKAASMYMKPKPRPGMRSR